MSIIQKLLSTLKSNRTLTVNLAGVVCLKGVALLLSFIMTPMYLRFFDNQSFLGVWYTIQSILVWILTCDLGVGNGVRNRLAKAITNGDREEAKRIVSSGYIVIGIIAICMIVILSATVPLINWNTALNTDIASQALIPVMMLTMIGIVLQVFCGLVSSILMALRRNIFANSLGTVTNVIILIFLLLPHSSDNTTRFKLLAIVYVAATILPLLAATVILFSGQLRDIKPSRKYWDKHCAKTVLRDGGAFFAIQISLLVTNYTNQLMISQIYGPSAVVDYTFYHRLYNLVPMIFTLFTQPVWSEVTVRYSRHDIKWIRHMYRNMLLLAVLFIVGSGIITLALPTIFKIWLGANSGIIADRRIGAIFLAWNAVEVLIYAATTIANGMMNLKSQRNFTVGAAVLKIPVTLLLSGVIPAWYSVVVSHALILLPLAVAQNVDNTRKTRIQKLY